MKLLKMIYEKTTGKDAPYYYNYSIGKILMKPFRKWLTNTVAYNCPFNTLRILIYKICGFKIGKHCFIGMHTYMDDMCYDLMKIGDECIISYRVYFACHGRHQGHYPIIVEDRAYIGMRASIISKNTDKSREGICIGKDAVVGACTLVNKDIPDNATAVGIPCTIIMKENENE